MSTWTEEQVLSAFTKGDLLELGRQADAMRRKMHPHNLATFIIDRNINYTNVCTSECKFCAFYKKPGQAGAYVLSEEEMLTKVQETIDAGGTQIMLQGGLHPDLDLSYFENMLRTIKNHYDITIHSFSPAEVMDLAKKSGLSCREVLLRLKDAGLDSLPGGGAEILHDEVRRRVSPQKILTEDWLHVMREAHAIGLESTATMVIGMGETFAHRLHHFQAIKKLQEETGGFRAFIMWSFQPGHTELGGEKTSTWDYLKTLALARLYLTNISHIQGSWVTQGSQVGQVTLAFGADDLGSIMLEENVVKAAGTANRMSTDHMVHIIRSAGLIPAQRNTKYEVIKRFE